MKKFDKNDDIGMKNYFLADWVRVLYFSLSFLLLSRSLSPGLVR
jgi:hypothetical protein